MAGLRVIAGRARGRKLKSVPGDSTRPITDRVKESLFDIIGGDIVGATLLDLFAGTGSVGIEALSRGAAFARFNDKDRMAVATIRHNVETTGFTSQAEILSQDAFTLLARAADRQFDYIYIAPPQYKNIWKQALQAVDRKPAWLTEDAWVIVQIHPMELEELVLHNLEEIEHRKYGSTLLVFYQRKESL